MFVVNTNIEVNWILEASVDSYNHTDFDVIIKKPDGIVTYLEGNVDGISPIKSEDFTPNTEIMAGSASHYIIPDQIGVWVIVLTNGIIDSNTIYYEYFLRVSEPDTHIYQQVTV